MSGTTEAMKGQAMITNIKARYANGVLTLLEPLDLEEGTEVMVSVEGRLFIDLVDRI